MKPVSYPSTTSLSLICEVNVSESEIGTKSEDFLTKQWIMILP